MSKVVRNGKPSKLLAVGATAYLKNVRAEMSQLLARTDDSLRVHLGQVYAAAEYLRDDLDEWQAFCEQEEWLSFKGRPRATSNHSKNALRHAIRFAVGFDGAKANSTVHRYNNALKGWWQNKVAAAEIPKLLEQSGGVERMKRANAAGLLVKLRESRITELIGRENGEFDVLAFIRFHENVDGTREIEILTGHAMPCMRVRPKIELFERSLEGLRKS